MDFFRVKRPGLLAEAHLIAEEEPSSFDEATKEIASEVHRMLDLIRSDFRDPTKMEIFEKAWFDNWDTERLAEAYNKSKKLIRNDKYRVMRRLREEFFEVYGDASWPFRFEAGRNNSS